jgi:hypothetical protein
MVGQILVGIDGSEGSRCALRWAIEEAAAHQAILDAILVWPSPYQFSHARYDIPLREPEVAAAARDLLAKTVSECPADGRGLPNEEAWFAQGSTARQIMHQGAEVRESGELAFRHSVKTRLCELHEHKVGGDAMLLRRRSTHVP